MKIDWHRVGGPLPDGSARWGIVVRVTDGEHCGWGEASPLPGYSPDTLAEVEAAVGAWRPPSCADTEAAIAAATADVAAPSARAALETALLDLAAQRSRQPLHRWLGGRAPQVIPITPLVESPGDEPPPWFRAWYAAGHRHAKVKVGRDPERELRGLSRWHAAFPKVRWRADANRTLPVGEAAAFCAALASYGVDSIEEPVPATALRELPRLLLGVALDESLQGADAATLITTVAACQSLHAVVLKPPALGGLLRCRALAAEAARHGADAIVTHVFDGPVACAAAAELALSLPNAASAGLWPHRAAGVFPRRRAAAIGETALVPHDRPGLGLSPEDA